LFLAIVVYDKIKWPTAEPVGGARAISHPDINGCSVYDILASWLEIKLSAAGASTSPDVPKKLDFEGEEYFDVSNLS